MGVAGTLIICPKPYERTFVPSSHGESVYKLVSIDLPVSEEMPAEKFDDADADDEDAYNSLAKTFEVLQDSCQSDRNFLQDRGKIYRTDKF